MTRDFKIKNKKNKNLLNPIYFSFSSSFPSHLPPPPLLLRSLGKAFYCEVRYSIEVRLSTRVRRWFINMHRPRGKAARKKKEKEKAAVDETGTDGRTDGQSIELNFPRRVNNLSNSYSLRSIRRISVGKQWCPGIDFPNVRIPQITCQGVSQYYSGNDPEHSWNSTRGGGGREGTGVASNVTWGQQ